MRNNQRPIKIFLVILMAVLINACEKDYFYQSPPPPTSSQTSTLEAIHVSAAPSTINSAYWKTADYLKVNASNVSTNQLYGDGLLNMTGTFSGLTSFNSGGSGPGLILKAAYDNDNLYILAEWTDSTLNLSQSSWMYNGPGDSRKPLESSLGWTSQRNSDRIAFAFEINNASSAAGTFSDVGCAASCHANGGNSLMHPDIGTVDLWNWNLALTAPLGYAQDMVANTGNLSDDNGQKIAVRNVNGATDRSGPAYEFNGTSQSVILSTGPSSTLDAAFYLLNKTPFTGDMHNGDSIYHSIAPPGDCASCHGISGEGISASALNTIELNRKSRSTLVSNMDGISDMGAYWGPLTSSQKNDVIAYLRGLSGVPGYYLNTPTGSNADIKSVNNVSAIQIKNALYSYTNKHTIYKVLFIRKLKTGNADDAQFDLALSKSYKFGVAVMDNDGKNHVGSALETLTFK